MIYPFGCLRVTHHLVLLATWLSFSTEFIPSRVKGVGQFRWAGTNKWTPIQSTICKRSSMGHDVCARYRYCLANITSCFTRKSYTNKLHPKQEELHDLKRFTSM